MAPLAVRFNSAVAKLKNFSPVKYISLAERLKGGRLERYAFYWHGVYKDYHDVFIEVLTDAKTRPIKFTAIVAGLGGLYYAVQENPDEQSFRDRLILNSNRLLLTTPSLRNPATTRHLIYLTRCYNEGLIRRYSFGVFSILWMDNYDRACDLYASQCSYLKPQYLTFNRRVVDVGFLGCWHILKSQVVDYDVNPKEWGERVAQPITALTDSGSFSEEDDAIEEPEEESSVSDTAWAFFEKLKRVANVLKHEESTATSS